VLTLASVLMLPSTVIAGVMGMTFEVGLFGNPAGFWIVIGLMAVVAGTTLAVARHRRWIGVSAL
jgi:Mg2+ and Co2+ transporter CorA